MNSRCILCIPKPSIDTSRGWFHIYVSSSDLFSEFQTSTPCVISSGNVSQNLQPAYSVLYITLHFSTCFIVILLSVFSPGKYSVKVGSPELCVPYSSLYPQYIAKFLVCNYYLVWIDKFTDFNLSHCKSYLLWRAPKLVYLLSFTIWWSFNDCYSCEIYHKTN